MGVAFARAALAVFLGVLSGGPRHDAACLTACLSGSMAAANLRRRRFLRLMLDASVRKLGSHLQAAEDTRGYAIKEGGGRVAPAHRMIISHNLVEPIGAIGVAGSNPHCSRDMLQRGRALLQLGRRRRPSVKYLLAPVVAAAIVDLLAGGPQIDAQALLPRPKSAARGSSAPTS